METAVPLRALPPGNWTVALGLALILAGVMAGGVELGWRSLGHLPTVDPEDLDLWAARRRAASNGARETVVILGKSRSQMDLDLATFEARYPHHKIIQLSLRGRGAWAAFEDLVHDPNFRGKVLFSITEPDLVPQEAEGQRRAVNRAKDMGPDEHLNALVRAELSERLVIRSAELKPERVLTNAARGRTPTPQFIIVGADRRAYADFTRINVELIKRQVEAVQQRSSANMRGRRPNAQAWLKDALRIRPLIEALRRHGGDVVFLHLPVSDSSARFSETFYPKATFWDPFVRQVGARAVHYRDVASLTGFECPDTSHLDKRDAPRFTAALLDELARQGFL